MAKSKVDYSPKFVYFEDMVFRDWLVFYIVFVFGFLSILSNTGALIVVKKNAHLSWLVATYLCMEHLTRIAQSVILFYPGVCTFIRTDARQHWAAHVSDEAEYGYYIYRKHRSICECWVPFGAPLNMTLGIYFYFAQHAIEMIQLGLSLNRLAALAFEGRFSELMTSSKLHQLLAVFTIPVSGVYWVTLEAILYYETHSYALISTEYAGPDVQIMMFKLRMVANGLTLGALLSDVITFGLIRRHLEKNRHLSSQNLNQSRADMKLAKQMIVNHTYSLAVTAVNFYIAFLVRNQLLFDSEGFHDADAYNEIQRAVVYNSMIMQTSWFLTIVTTCLPAVGNAVSGFVTIVFLGEIAPCSCTTGFMQRFQRSPIGRTLLVQPRADSLTVRATKSTFLSSAT